MSHFNRQDLGKLNETRFLKKLHSFLNMATSNLYYFFRRPSKLVMVARIMSLGMLRKPSYRPYFRSSWRTPCSWLSPTRKSPLVSGQEVLEAMKCYGRSLFQSSDLADCNSSSLLRSWPGEVVHHPAWRWFEWSLQDLGRPGKNAAQSFLCIFFDFPDDCLVIDCWGSVHFLPKAWSSLLKLLTP